MPSQPIIPPTRPQKSSWEIRNIYEGPQRDLLESTEFMIPFGRLHNIDGHNIMSVLSHEAHSYEHDGISESRSVLIVSLNDMQGMKINDSLRIDGNIYIITQISRPSGDIVRLELLTHD